ncbi:MAG TPA: 4-(cytidine 5'-diphospho)-2-C-methyl-D-erythritol kinase [Thiolapillus brandeum]|uniref:4-diphosphocytidyl-2-C-methyl-D-erythritol kinase n=1 Tax=Thiolapillus brandeum TaxID=1076588 RepID=A0A831NW36_9GAMM|nr:4-(cytidine 5'-diphospho)-2-C-methyl-D-erythritol kinase [Thiolapillus brandeum]
MNITDIFWPAPAKLNLMLRVVGQCSDGYHLLQTVFQFLAQSDLIRFQPRTDDAIHCVTPLTGVEDNKNLAILAAQLLQKESNCRQGVDIQIVKNLPMGSGLGGGSSNAATTLVVLNKLWGLDLGPSKLAELGLQLGADVPVFIHGRAAWAEGVGEKLQFFEPRESWYLVLVPACHVSTAEIFCDSELTRDAEPITIRDFSAGETANTCQSLVAHRYPEVSQALSWLEQFAEGRLTGTGACVFAEFASQQQAMQVLGKLPADMKGFVSPGLNRSPLHTQLEQFIGAWPSG